jgi:signal recognition particle subunit SRP54
LLENIQKRFDNVFKKLSGKHKISEDNIKDGIREIKLALLEADVNYKVVKEFVKEVKEEALGEKVIKSVSPKDQFIKIVNDKLAEIMGGENKPLELKPSGINVILMVGLQGSGKTTTCGKLAYRLTKNDESKKALLVGADIYRPAAKEQLKIVAKQSGAGFFTNDDPKASAKKITKSALDYAREENYNLVILDTAGRLQIDEELMKELEDIKKVTKPDEILFVSDAMAGQNIVEVANEFDERLGISGIVLTKFDSDTRGGAALSLKKTTGKDIKYIGVGEKMEELDPFYPDRIAGRILGMGDVVSLVDKAIEASDQEELERLQKKMQKLDFDLNDFLGQIRQVKRMGSLENLLKMLPFGKDLPVDQLKGDEVSKTEAIILSMTPKERKNYKIINVSRKKRISRGSGTKLKDVNKLLQQFDKMNKMMKKMKKNKKGLQSLMDKYGGDLENMDVKDLEKIRKEMGGKLPF